MERGRGNLALEIGQTRKKKISIQESESVDLGQQAKQVGGGRFRRGLGSGNSLSSTEEGV